MKQSLLLFSLCLFLPTPSFAQDKAKPELNKVVFSQFERKKGTSTHTIDLSTGKKKVLEHGIEAEQCFVWTRSPSGRYLGITHGDKRSLGAGAYDLSTKTFKTIVKGEKGQRFATTHFLNDETVIAVVVKKDEHRTVIYRINIDGTKKKDIYSGSALYDWDDAGLSMAADGSTMVFQAAIKNGEKFEKRTLVLDLETGLSTSLPPETRHAYVAPDGKTFCWYTRKMDKKTFEVTITGHMGHLDKGKLVSDKKLDTGSWPQQVLSKSLVFTMKRVDSVNLGEIWNLQSGKKTPFAKGLRYDDGITRFLDFDAKSNRILWLEPQKRPKKEYRLFTATLGKDGLVGKKQIHSSEHFTLPPFFSK